MQLLQEEGTHNMITENFMVSFPRLQRKSIEGTSPSHQCEKPGREANGTKASLFNS